MRMTSTLHRTLLIGAPVFVLAVLLTLQGPIPQEAAYHDFADQRGFLGVDHGQNVWSNLLFLIAGVIGFRRARFLPATLRPAGIVLSLFLALTAIGSAYYHEAPRDATLVWDRMPLAVAFMALITMLFADRVDPRWSRVLPISALLGAGSVGWWAWTGDLRPYALVQFGGLVLIVMLLWLGRTNVLQARWLLVALLSYVLAKVFEMTDAWVFAQSSGAFAGHMLKHLVAGIGAVALVLAMPAEEARRR